MKPVEKEKITKEIIAYESIDGKIFATEAECKKYEESAAFAITEAFKKVIIGKEISEYTLDYFGCGSEEFMYAIVDIKDNNILKIVNQYMWLRGNKMVAPEFIGKIICIPIGYYYENESKLSIHPKTEEQMVEEFKNHIHKYFVSGDTERS